MIDWEKERHKFKNLGELIAFIECNFTELYNTSAKVSRHGSTHRRITAKHELDNVSIEINRLNYGDSIRNGHSCPKGGVMNWYARDEDGPIGYPGLKGDIRVSYESNSYLYGVGDMLTDLLIHSGSGGGGGCNDAHRQGISRYEFTLWGDDWPTIMSTMLDDKKIHTNKEDARRYEHELDVVQAKLAGTRSPYFRSIPFQPFKESICPRK